VSNKKKANNSIATKISFKYFGFRFLFSNSFFTMYGNIAPLTTVGGSQVLSSNGLPTTTVGNNDLVIIQDTTTATSQAELINQLQNHITENQQILIITDDQGQDQCK
jgi:hypothetical protein